MSSLPRSTQAAILRDLATHPKMRAAMGVVALRHDVTATIVSEVAKAHGYPDKQAMWAAAEQLRPSGERVDSADDDDEQPAAPIIAAPARPDPPRSRPGGMLGLALSHPDPKVRATADRVHEQMERLGALMRAADAKIADRQRKAAKIANAERDVARLTEQLAAAKRRLHDLRGGGSVRAESLSAAMGERRERQATFLRRHGVTAADVRAWCAANGVVVHKAGFLPDHVVAAYEAAHTSERAAS